MEYIGQCVQWNDVYVIQLAEILQRCADAVVQLFAGHELVHAFHAT